MATRSREHVSDFAELVEARSTALLRLAYAVVGDHQLAQDLLQESLVKAYVAWPRLRDLGQRRGVRAPDDRDHGDLVASPALLPRAAHRRVPEPAATATRPTGSPTHDDAVAAACGASTASARGARAALLRGPVRGADRGADGLLDGTVKSQRLRGTGQARANGWARRRGVLRSPRTGGDPMTTTLRESHPADRPGGPAASRHRGAGRPRRAAVCAGAGSPRWRAPAPWWRWRSPSRSAARP